MREWVAGRNLAQALVTGVFDPEDATYVALWHDAEPAPEAMAHLAEAGFADPAGVVTQSNTASISQDQTFAQTNVDGGTGAGGIIRGRPWGRRTTMSRNHSPT